MKRAHSVRLLDEAAADLRRLQDFALARERASDTPDWETPERALEAIGVAMRFLEWSPHACRKAALGNGRTRELIVPFGASGYVVLFEVIADDVVVGAVRHQREDDYQH